jgi:hypothetical protein
MVSISHRSSSPTSRYLYEKHFVKLRNSSRHQRGVDARLCYSLYPRTPGASHGA